MAAENLADLMSSLTPAEQESVKRFVDFLKRRESAGRTPFLAARSTISSISTQNCSAVSPSDLLSRGGRGHHRPARLIAQFGGSLSIRDRGALVDGNKRIAVTVTAAFLQVNRYRFEFNDIDTFAFLLGLYEAGTRSRNSRLGCANMSCRLIGQSETHSQSNFRGDLVGNHVFREPLPA
jgi:hypothetical protein